jgi:hypothetical protein
MRHTGPQRMKEGVEGVVLIAREEGGEARCVKEG